MGTSVSPCLVAVQISTKTCGPCKVVYPHFAGLSEELPDVTFVKIMGRALKPCVGFGVSKMWIPQ